MSISVLMSVYKSENANYLDKAISSIWEQQTLRPDEVVLIEDGPLRDDIYNVILKWSRIMKHKLVIIKNEQNMGLTKSLNRGIAVIKSDFIARMDSDDISHPERFEKQCSYLKIHPDVAIVGGTLQEFDEDNKCLSIRHYPLTNDDVLNYIYKASPLAHPSVMMRRSIFENGLKYNEKYRTSQDIALWFDALKKGYKINNIKDIAIYFRRDGNIYKRRNRSKACNEFKIYMRGIWNLYGPFTLKYFFPIARFIFRLLPTCLVKWGYNCNLRKSLLE